jgi:pyruvate ferredoxin oxidoreductase beta subunit
MDDSGIKKGRDLNPERLLAPGAPTCAGCGALSAIHQVCDILGEKTVFVNAAGCMTLLSIYPFTPFRGSWLYTAMACASAGAQGVRDALDVLIEKNHLRAEDDRHVVVLTGDGSASGMGLAATSAAIHRQLDFICICYDNEGYGNTGHQSSGSTPHGAVTATSKGQEGFRGTKKDLFSIWTASKPAYAATVTAAFPLDLARKVERASKMHGPRMLILFSPCPPGWHFDPQDSIHIGKLAVNTGIWPLKEYMDGKVTHTKVPKKRLPVEDYLKTQNRFAHLFKPGNEGVIREIQGEIDRYWAAIE